MMVVKMREEGKGSYDKSKDDRCAREKRRA